MRESAVKHPKNHFSMLDIRKVTAKNVMKQHNDISNISSFTWHRVYVLYMYCSISFHLINLWGLSLSFGTPLEQLYMVHNFACKKPTLCWQVK